MIGLCIGLAGMVWAQLPTPDFTLAWTHTIEKIRWEEDYRVTAEGLQLETARIRGTGAGMEVPDGAELRDGSWQYRPRLPVLSQLHLGRSPAAGDYQVCFAGACQPMANWIGPPRDDPSAVELWPCEIAPLN